MLVQYNVLCPQAIPYGAAVENVATTVLEDPSRLLTSIYKSKRNISIEPLSNEKHLHAVTRVESVQYIFPFDRSNVRPFGVDKLLEIKVSLCFPFI